MYKWIATIGCLAFLLGGCTDATVDNDLPGNGGKVTGEDVQREIGEAADTTAKYAGQKKDEYVRNMEQQLEEMDEEIAQLELKAGDLSDDAAAEWKEQLQTLKTKRKTAGDKLDELKASSADAWEEFRTDADNAWSSLSNSFQDAARRFD